ncbi:MAG: hypothetical protein RJB13_1343, partial [Pseudomonadota bacterium]
MEIDSESQSDPNFWNDRRKSSKILKEKKALEDGFESVAVIQRLGDDALVLIEFGESGDEASV